MMVTVQEFRALFQKNLNELIWRDRGWGPIPIHGKGEKGWTKEEKLSYSVRKAKKEETILSNGKIISSERIYTGVTEPELVTYENGVKAVFKKGLNKDMPSNEVAAYNLDKAMGFGIVPTTVLRNHNNIDGSAQKFVTNHVTASEFKSKINNEDFQKMRTLDFLIWNRDRHPENYLVSKYGKITAIDHGNAFTNSQIFNVPTGALNYTRSDNIPKSILTSLRNLDDENLKSALSISSNHKILKSVKKRRDFLLKNEVFPNQNYMNDNRKLFF